MMFIILTRMVIFLVFSAKELDHKGMIKSKKVTKTIKRNGIDTQSAKRADISSTMTVEPDSSLSVNSTNTAASISSSQASSNYVPNVATSRTNAAKKIDQIKRKQQSKLNTAAKEAALTHSKLSGPSKTERERAKAALLAVPIRYTGDSANFRTHGGNLISVLQPTLCVHYM